MKNIALTLLVALSLCSCSRLKILPSNDEAESKLTPQQFKAAWEKSTSLAPQHQLLNSFVGSWTTKVVSWMDPESVPHTSEGRTNQKMVLGGRFLLDDYHGEFEGKKFSGIGLVGFDTIKNKYISFWADSLGTGFFESEGSYDEASRTMTLSGKMTDPARMTIREIISVTKLIDSNHYVFEMYEALSPNMRFKTLEINYTRIDK